MTYHFVNLISWDFVNKIKNPKKVIFFDSISIVFLSRLFGVKKNRISGLNFFKKNKKSFDDALFLVSQKTKENRNEYELPFWEKIEDIRLYSELSMNIEKYSKIIIGISSPKQDLLAQKIIELFPEKNIYCLGAAIYNSGKYSSFFDRLNINYIFLLFVNFNRTLIKINLTFKEIFSILFSDKRNDFISFLKSISLN